MNNKSSTSVYLLTFLVTFSWAWIGPTIKKEELFSKSVKFAQNELAMYQYDKNPFVSAFSIKLTPFGDKNDATCKPDQRHLQSKLYNLSDLPSSFIYTSLSIYLDYAFLITNDYKLQIYKLTLVDNQPVATLQIQYNYEPHLTTPKPVFNKNQQDQFLVATNPDYTYLFIFYQNQAIYFYFSQTISSQPTTVDQFFLYNKRLQTYAVIHVLRLLYIAAGDEGVDIYEINHYYSGNSRFSKTLNQQNLQLNKTLKAIDIVSDYYNFVYILCANNGILILQSNYDVNQVKLLYIIPEGATNSSLAGTPKKITVYKNSTLLLVREQDVGQSTITEINLNIKQQSYIINKQVQVNEQVKSIKAVENYALVQTPSSIKYFYHSFDFNYSFSNQHGTVNLDSNVFTILQLDNTILNIDIIQGHSYDGLLGVITGQQSYIYQLQELAPSIVCNSEKIGEYQYNVVLRSQYCNWDGDYFSHPSSNISKICETTQDFTCTIKDSNDITSSVTMLVLLIILIFVVVLLVIFGSIYLTKKYKSDQIPSEEQKQFRRYKSLDKKQNQNAQQNNLQHQQQDDFSHIEVEMQHQQQSDIMPQNKESEQE